MKIDLPNLIPILNKLKISITQFSYLIMVHEKLYATMYQYDSLNVGFTKDEIEDLVQKGYIMKISNNPELYVDGFETTEKFRSALFNNNKDAVGEEFWAAFPSYIIIDGRKIPAKSLDKDKFFAEYYKRVGKYKEFHDSVMEALRFAVSRNAISMGIEKWFLSEQWNEVTNLKKLETHAEFPGSKIF